MAFMKEEKIIASSKKEQFVTDIESMILSGALPIGSKIPSERELAESMGLSKTVVNSGILEMENKGFLTVIPRQGTYVQDYKRYGKIDALLSIMSNHYCETSKQELKSFFEMRLVIEKLALELAIPKLSDNDLNDLTNLYETIENAESDENACLANFYFHHEICYLSGNVICPLLLSSFKVPILHVWENYVSINGRTQMIKNANDLMCEIKNKDVKGAVTVLENIINYALNDFK